MYDYKNGYDEVLDDDDYDEIEDDYETMDPERVPGQISLSISNSKIKKYKKS